MKSYQVYNVSEDSLLLNNVQLANNFFKRLKGLIGVRALSNNKGLIIRPCKSIHTFGMKINIDVAFIDKNNRVIKIIEDMEQKKLSPIVKGSKYVIEAKAGKFKRTLRVGNEIKVSEN